jgi:hypothetical protein
VSSLSRSRERPAPALFSVPLRRAPPPSEGRHLRNPAELDRPGAGRPGDPGGGRGEGSAERCFARPVAGCRGARADLLVLGIRAGHTQVDRRPARASRFLGVHLGEPHGDRPTGTPPRKTRDRSWPIGRRAPAGRRRQAARSSVRGPGSAGAGKANRVRFGRCDPCESRALSRQRPRSVRIQRSPGRSEGRSGLARCVLYRRPPLHAIAPPVPPRTCDAVPSWKVPACQGAGALPRSRGSERRRA